MCRGLRLLTRCSMRLRSWSLQYLSLKHRLRTSQRAYCHHNSRSRTRLQIAKLSTSARAKPPSSQNCMNSQRLAHTPARRVSFAPDTNRPTTANQAAAKAALSTKEALEVWQHAVLLFKHYDWSEAIVFTQRLLRRSPQTPGIDRAAVWANLGILRLHLGEYYLALEAFEKAMKEAGATSAHLGASGPSAATAGSEPHPLQNRLGRGGGRPIGSGSSGSGRADDDNKTAAHHPHRPDAPIYPFLAGCAAYHLEGSKDPSGYRVAQSHFRACLALMPEGVDEIDLTPHGLPWTLERIRVVWNERNCGVEADWEEGMGELVAGKHYGINRMPGGICFEPPLAAA